MRWGCTAGSSCRIIGGAATFEAAPARRALWLRARRRQSPGSQGVLILERPTNCSLTD